jgi:hypothetical protein
MDLDKRKVVLVLSRCRQSDCRWTPQVTEAQTGSLLPPFGATSLLKEVTLEMGVGSVLVETS